MPEMRIHVPTYYGSSNRPEPEFGDPYVPVVVRPAEGLRVVLGSHDYWHQDSPDIQVERRPNGWAIFLHPVGAGDLCGCVYYLDDGRSFLLPEREFATPTISVLSPDDELREIDGLTDPASRETCQMCGFAGSVREGSAGMCESCEERMSRYLKNRRLSNADRSTVEAILKAEPKSGEADDPGRKRHRRMPGK